MLDEVGRMGNYDRTSYPALFARLKYDFNHAKCCCIAWQRATAINFRARFYSNPLVDLIAFRNNVAILRSNIVYSRQDVVGTLGIISRLHTYIPQSDIPIIRCNNEIVALIGENILEMEALITHLDAVITHSRDEHLHTKDQLGAAEEGMAVVIPLDEEFDKEEPGPAYARKLSPPLVPNEDGIIDLCED